MVFPVPLRVCADGILKKSRSEEKSSPNTILPKPTLGMLKKPDKSTVNTRKSDDITLPPIAQAAILELECEYPKLRATGIDGGQILHVPMSVTHAVPGVVPKRIGRRAQCILQEHDGPRFGSAGSDDDDCPALCIYL